MSRPADDAFPCGGAVASGFEPVREAFFEAQRRDEGGAQLSVYRRGAKVVDLWAGWDRANRRPYGEDTISVLMSCTKGAVALAAHRLVERGRLDLDAPVARYWPRFAAAGKGDVRVAEILSHSAGLMGFDHDSGLGAADLFDQTRCAAALEAMAPLWPPGTAAYYHFITFGVLVSELIRRVSGKTAGVFVADEIAGPLGLDLWIGLPAEEEPRRAPHFAVGPTAGPEAARAMLEGFGGDPNSRLGAAFLHTLATTGAALDLVNASREARAAELPAGNGIGDARSLARMYAALIGELDGHRLLSPAAVARAAAPVTPALPTPAGLPPMGRPGEAQAWGLGFEVASVPRPMLGPGSFGHSGAGGRLGYAHPPSGIAVAYVCNAMVNSPTGPDPRWIGWTEALKDAPAI